MLRSLIPFSLLLLFACSPDPINTALEDNALEAADLTPLLFIDKTKEAANSESDAIQAGRPVNVGYEKMERATRLYNFQDIPKGWINEKHLEELMDRLESDEECLFNIQKHGCTYESTCSITEGKLARLLLTSYIKRTNPADHLSSIYPSMLTEEEINDWVKDFVTRSL